MTRRQGRSSTEVVAATHALFPGDPGAPLEPTDGLMGYPKMHRDALLRSPDGALWRQKTSGHLERWLSCAIPEAQGRPSHTGRGGGVLEVKAQGWPPGGGWGSPAWGRRGQGKAWGP